MVKITESKIILVWSKFGLSFCSCRVCLSVVLTFLFGLVFQGVGQGLRIPFRSWKFGGKWTENSSGRTILETKDQNIFDQMWTGLSYAEVTALRKRKLEWLRPQGNHCWNDLLLFVHCFEMRHFNALVQVALVAMFRLIPILHIQQYGKSKNMACDVEFRAYPCAVPASRSSLHSLWNEQCPLESMLLSGSSTARHLHLFWPGISARVQQRHLQQWHLVKKHLHHLHASGIVWMLDES